LNTTGSLDLRLEKAFPPTQREYLHDIGFKVATGAGPFVSAVRRDPKSRTFEGRNHSGDPFEMKQQSGNSDSESGSAR
ncbi:MAG: hypothetical protein ACXWJB_10550, partial [Limisphaerales bacterium]